MLSWALTAGEPVGQMTLAQFSVRFKTRVVRVAREGFPPLSGFIHNCKCVTPTAVTAQSSRSKVVPGGLKFYS